MIFVTGVQDSKLIVTALKAGAFDYVIKDVQGEFMPLLKATLPMRGGWYADAPGQGSGGSRGTRSTRPFRGARAGRAVLLQEVNHRVGNSLQLIAAMLHMQGQANPGEAVKAALPEADQASDGGRPGAPPSLHLRRREDGGGRSISGGAGRRPTKFRRRRRVRAIHLPPTGRNRSDRAVAIGIIVNELVINALKYAYPQGKGPIRVALKARNESAQCCNQRRG